MTLTRTLFALTLALSLPLLACGDDGGDTTETDTAEATDTSAADDTTAAQTDTEVAADTTTAPACNPITQTGCPTDAENCTFNQDSDAPICVAEGTLAYGETCGGDEACERGICLSLNGTDYLCYQFCQTKLHCDGNTDCLELTDSVYKVCKIEDIYDTCDLLQQNCDDSDKACYAVAGENEPVCLPEGNAGVGDACDTAGACAGGNICVNSRCKQLCDRTATDPCGQFVACSQWVGNAGYCDD